MCEFCGTDNCGGVCATNEQLEALMNESSPAMEPKEED